MHSTGRAASEVEAACVLLRDHFAEDEVARILILSEGDRLEAGAAYLDLHDPTRAVAVARAGRAVGPGELLIPKAGTKPGLWARLTRPPGPGQTGG